MIHLTEDAPLSLARPYEPGALGMGYFSDLDARRPLTISVGMAPRTMDAALLRWAS